MGRPLNKKLFGNKNFPYQDQAVGGPTGDGGEGVATIAIATTGTLYTTSTTLNLSFTNPQITGGVKPTGTVTTDGTGNTTAVTLLTTGTGYTSAPTALVVGSNGTGTTATFTIALTSSVQNAIAFTSFLLAKDGGASAVAGGDIMKQESSRRYLVNNSQGRGQVKLVAKNTLVAGQMNIIATDFDGSTYFVTKLTAHKATLVNQYDTSTALVTLTTDADGVKTGATGWTLGSATGTTVTIASV